MPVMNKILLALLFVFLQFSSMSQNKELKKMYSKGKYDQLIEKAQILLAEKGSDPYLNSILGRAYANSKQFETAIPYLEKSMNSELASGEIKAISKAYLAKCYFIMGEEQKAVRYLKECQNVSDSKEASRYAHRYLNLFQSGVYYKAWEVVNSDHIRFHFQNKDKMKDAEAYMKRMQVNYQRIVSFFEITPSKKVDIFIWNDRNEAFRKLNRPIGFSNSDLCIINVWDQQEDDYELCHMLSQMTLKPKK
jgi:tetratricopeptide (TPR) repeat protein